MGWPARVRATRACRRPSVQRRRPSARSTSQVARSATSDPFIVRASPWCCGSGRFTEDAGICLGLQAACGLIVPIEPAPAARSRCQPRPSPRSMTRTESATLSSQRGRLVCVLALRDRSSRQVRAGSADLRGRRPDADQDPGYPDLGILRARDSARRGLLVSSTCLDRDDLDRRREPSA